MAAVSRTPSLADYRICPFVVMRSGSGDLGKWLTEHRNVAEDYVKIFGEFPDDPRAITISIDSNDTHSIAESFMGPIVFRTQ